MKKGHKKLLLFELFLLIMLLVNSFVLNILAKYNIVIFLLVSIILFKIIFGIEKDRNRYVKDIIYEVIIFLMVFFLVYYLSGIFIGFVKTDNYYSYYGITTFIIPIILTIILKEYLRYNVLKKSEGSKLLNFIVYLLFIMIDLTNIMSLTTFSSAYKLFMFFALTLLPTISNNIFCTYVSLKYGYKPNIIYLIVINLYSYMLPLVPNLNDYLYSIVFIIYPLFMGYRVYLFNQKYNFDSDMIPGRKKKDYILIMVSSIFLIVIVYLTSGYFKYYAITIGSGSMFPNIKVGDIVIIEKIDKNYEKIEVGDIIAYSRSNVTVVHRLENMVEEDGKRYYYTKGDANKDIDNYVIKEEEILGVVNNKIPYIGLPVIWLKGL